jgi:hypothetical protein
MANNQKKLKAFVRYDGSGRVVASSLILRKNKPRVGRWYEIPEYLCCNGVPSSTTTTTTSGGGGTPTAWTAVISNSGTSDAWKACNNFGTAIIAYTSVTSIVAGTPIYSDAALTTLIPYSFGAIAINGLVYDIVNGSTNPLGGNGTPCEFITTTTSTTTVAPSLKSFTWNDTLSNINTVCGTPNVFSLTYYFTGAGTYPAIGDTIYINTSLLPLNTQGAYGKMSNNSAFATTTGGLVTDVFSC